MVARFQNNDKVITYLLGIPCSLQIQALFAQNLGRIKYLNKLKSKNVNLHWRVLYLNKTRERNARPRRLLAARWVTLRRRALLSPWLYLRRPLVREEELIFSHHGLFLSVYVLSSTRSFFIIKVCLCIEPKIYSISFIFKLTSFFNKQQ